MEGAPVPATRDTFQGPQHVLVTAFKPYITVPGFIRYCEHHHEKIDKHLTWQHAPLVRAMHQVQGNMSFPKRIMTDSLLEIGREKQFFDAAPTMLTEWARVCSARLRTMGRHMAQSVLKARGSSSSWVAIVLSPRVTQVATIKIKKLMPPSPPNPLLQIGFPKIFLRSLEFTLVSAGIGVSQGCHHYSVHVLGMLIEHRSLLPCRRLVTKRCRRRWKP